MAFDSYIPICSKDMIYEAFSSTDASEYGLIFNLGKRLGGKKEGNIHMLYIQKLNSNMIYNYWIYYRNNDPFMIEKYGLPKNRIEYNDLENPVLLLDIMNDIFTYFRLLDKDEIENEHLFLRIICEGEGEVMIFRLPKRIINTNQHFSDGHKFEVVDFSWNVDNAPIELIEIRKQNPYEGQYISIQFFLPKNCPQYIRDIIPR